MRTALPIMIVLATLVACAPRPDPRVQAAQDFRDTAYALIGKDEDQARRLNALRLGMSDEEVLNAAGAPSRRESRTLDDERVRETWSYDGELKSLGTLTFEDRRLVQVLTP